MPTFGYEQKVQDAYGMGFPMTALMGMQPQQQAGPGGGSFAAMMGGSQPAQQAPGGGAPSYIDTAFQAAPENYGLQGMTPGDLAGMDREQRDLMMAMTSGGAQRLSDFESRMPGLISQSTEGAYGGALEAMAGQRRNQLAMQQDQLAAGGLSSSQLFSRIANEQAQGWANPMAQLGFQARQQQGQGLMDLYGNVLSARNQMEQFYDQLMLQQYLNSKSREQARASGKKAMLGSALGALGSIAMAV